MKKYEIEIVGDKIKHKQKIEDWQYARIIAFLLREDLKERVKRGELLKE